MYNLFHNGETVEEPPVYSIHLDQLADKEYKDFIKRIDYIEEGPVPITHTTDIGHNNAYYSG